MTRIKNTLSQFREIENFVLVSPSGYLLDHDMSNPGETASLTALCGLGSGALAASTGFTRFNYLMLNRVDNRNFIIFQHAGNYLGIQQMAGVDSRRLVTEIGLALDELMMEEPSAPAPL